jgi:hypothetical protein
MTIHQVRNRYSHERNTQLSVLARNVESHQQSIVHSGPRFSPPACGPSHVHVEARDRPRSDCESVFGELCGSGFQLTAITQGRERKRTPLLWIRPGLLNRKTRIIQQGSERF